MNTSDSKRPHFRSRREIHAEAHRRAHEEFLRETGQVPLVDETSDENHPFAPHSETSPTPEASHSSPLNAFAAPSPTQQDHNGTATDPSSSSAASQIAPSEEENIRPQWHSARRLEIRTTGIDGSPDSWFENMERTKPLPPRRQRTSNDAALNDELFPGTTSQRRERRMLPAAPGSALHTRDVTPASDAQTNEKPATGATTGLFDPVTPPAPRGEESAGGRSQRLEQERRAVRRRRVMRRIRAFFVLLIVLGLVAGAGWFAMRYLTDDTSSIVEADDWTGPGSTEVSVVIASGESGTAIGEKLVEAGVVKSLSAFTRAWEANKAAQSIRPGTYALRKEMSASGAIAALLDSTNRTDNTVTVIPGETIAQVVDRMTQVTDFSKEEIQAALKNSAAIGLPAEAKGNPEGWLCPGSYELAEGDTPETIFAQMVADTVKTLDELKVPPASRLEVLTKASIVEREVNIDEYLPKVARVIENRLSKPEGETRGLLQMDSTVLYGVNKTGGIPTEEDLASDTPYNTYRYPGLPPAPVSQPNRSAIEAVLSPAEGDWLYFVTVNFDTGETLFATTVEAQRENTKRLKEYCAAHAGKC